MVNKAREMMCAPASSTARPPTCVTWQGSHGRSCSLRVSAAPCDNLHMGACLGGADVGAKRGDPTAERGCGHQWTAHDGPDRHPKSSRKSSGAGGQPLRVVLIVDCSEVSMTECSDGAEEYA